MGINQKVFLIKLAQELYHLKILIFRYYFFMGDNRDCSKDSRFLSSVGYVNFNNLVGKAQIIFFSNNKKKGSFFKFWKWNESLRFSRLLMKIL